MRITIVAIGGRGDVQPLVALGAGLRRTGRYEISIVTSDDFDGLVGKEGLEFISLGMNAQELLMTEAAWDVLESGHNFLQGMWRIIRMMKPILEQIMDSTWQACQGTDAIIFSALGVGAYHIAEKQRVPCLWAIPFPLYSRTRSFPSLAFPSLPLGGIYNLFTHIVVEQFAQQLGGRFVNHWRRKRLGLPPISLFKWPYRHLYGEPVPVLYSYSPSIVPKPSDWGEHIHVTGYWFLDHSSDWKPPVELVDFLEAGQPPVYVGFGSMSNRDPEATAQIVIDALERSGQRGLIATGWGGLKSSSLPSSVFMLESAPHDWLFPRTTAVVHHGGAGTTAAGLRAGVPSVLVPHFGDQPFWGQQIVRLGVGPDPIPRRRLTADRLTHALRVAVTDEQMSKCAATLGQTIRAEDGIGNAVRIINQVIGGS